MSLTAAQQANLLGQQVSVRFRSNDSNEADVLFNCTIQDIKQAYGRYRFQVVPVSGTGSMWVEDSRLVGLAALLGQSKPCDHVPHNADVMQTVCIYCGAEMDMR